MTTTTIHEIRNLIGGNWLKPASQDGLELLNPATGEPLGRAPAGSAAEVDAAVQAAHAAFPAWRATPAADRVQFLFKLKNLLEEHLDELAGLITVENGKTFAESKAELRRGIENVEVACGIPVLMQGYSLEDVAPGIDEIMVRQPLGVVAAITPFNFPVMVPLWFLPYAIATGNTFVLKPSDRVPFGVARLVELIRQTGLPEGVVNLVQGGKAAVDALLDRWWGRSALWVPRRWPSTCTRADRPAANGCSARAGPKITWWCCRTPIRKRPPKSSPTRPSGAPGSAAWR
jgi:malonate-semialdehyde dehydrogenase (acetylating)/methylmalonate-semialdehyde dehydrogenase